MSDEKAAYLASHGLKPRPVIRTQLRGIEACPRCNSLMPTGHRCRKRTRRARLRLWLATTLERWARKIEP